MILTSGPCAPMQISEGSNFNFNVGRLEILALCQLSHPTHQFLNLTWHPVRYPY